MLVNSVKATQNFVVENLALSGHRYLSVLFVANSFPGAGPAGSGGFHIGDGVNFFGHQRMVWTVLFLMYTNWAVKF